MRRSDEVQLAAACFFAVVLLELLRWGTGVAFPAAIERRRIACRDCDRGRSGLGKGVAKSRHDGRQDRNGNQETPQAGTHVGRTLRQESTQEVSVRHHGGGGESQASRAGFGRPNRLADAPHRGRDCALDGGAGFLPWTQWPSVSVNCQSAVADLRGAAGAGGRRQAAAVVAACPLGRLGLGHPVRLARDLQAHWGRAATRRSRSSCGPADR